MNQPTTMNDIVPLFYLRLYEARKIGVAELQIFKRTKTSAAYRLE
jgi:hypothetical protein